MISRVAEACFWMNRQLERADAMAHLLRINRSFVLDSDLHPERRWYPLLIASGQHERFDELHPGDDRFDGDVTQEYLTWDRNNPVSIHSAVYWARENARTVRDIVSLEMWEVINDLWHWLRGGQGRRIYRTDIDGFYRHISNTAATFQGVCHNTMPHETAFDFMRVGLLLERAGQTARVLDVHHHTFSSITTTADVALSGVHWLALLRSCGGTSCFLRRVRATPTGPAVVGFLVLDETFPRSVLHCLNAAREAIARLDAESSGPGKSVEQLDALCGTLRKLSNDDLESRGVHDELTRIIDSVADLCSTIHEEYFNPVLSAATISAAPVEVAQSP